MNDIINYFNSEIYDEAKFNEHVNYLETNNLKIDLNIDKFKKFDKFKKKKIYKYLNSNKDIDIEKLNFLIDALSFKDKYLLTEKEIENITYDVENMLENEEILLNSSIDPYNFTRFSNLKNLNKINILYKNLNLNEKMGNFDYIKNHNKIENLGLYLLPKLASPGFKNFRKNINYLKKKFKLFLFLDDNKENMDSSDLKFLENVYEVNFVQNLDDEELKNLIYEKKLTIIIYIYGLYKRKNVVLNKPAPIQISYQEPPVVYPNLIYDYNLIDIHLYDILKTHSKIDESIYKFITLKNNFILPIPYYYDQIEIKEPNFNKNCIKIGLIAYSPKISHELINLINKIINLNPNIYITIFGYIEQNWIDLLFDTKQVILDTYDNSNPSKLYECIFFIDSISINNHSTALEIIKIKRPFIGYVNFNRYLGCFSYSLIKFLKMEKYFLADNFNDYINLIKLYTYNEKVYNRMYHKFIKKLNQSRVLENDFYISDFTDTLNEFYENYKKDNFV
jgi:hypothetical protein